MKKMMFLLVLITCIACECNDQKTLTELEIKLGKVNSEIEMIEAEMTEKSFDENPSGYFILDDEYSNLIIEKAFIEIDIDRLKEESKCL